MLLWSWKCNAPTQSRSVYQNNYNPPILEKSQVSMVICQIHYNIIFNFTDIDECEVDSPCTGQYKICQNTIGSYECGCTAGYYLDPATDHCLCKWKVYTQYYNGTSLKRTPLGPGKVESCPLFRRKNVWSVLTWDFSMCPYCQHTF